MATKELQGLLFTFVSDGASGEAMIRVGDAFDLIPPEKRARNKDRPAWMRQLFGPGPYVVTRIAYNPHPAFAGKPLLFCRRHHDGSEPGAFASEFQKARPRRTHLRRGHYFFNSTLNRGFDYADKHREAYFNVCPMDKKSRARPNREGRGACCRGEA